MIERPQEILKFFDIVYWLHGKWIPDIVVALWDGPKRYNELFHEIQERNISHGWSMKSGSLRKWPYAQTLERLERESVIMRIADDPVKPTKVTYELSPAFREFLDRHAGEVIAWSDRFRDLLDEARRSREEAQQGDPPD